MFITPGEMPPATNSTTPSTSPPVNKYKEYGPDDLKACLLLWCKADGTTTMAKITKNYQAESGILVPTSTLSNWMKKKIATTTGETLNSLKQKHARTLPADQYEQLVRKMIASLQEKGKKDKEAKMKALHESNRTMTPGEEDFIMRFCRTMSKAGYKLDVDMLVDAINFYLPKLCASLDPDTQVRATLKVAKGFLKRHENELGLKGSSGIDPKRVDQADDKVRQNFFYKLDRFIHFLYVTGRSKYQSFSDIPKHLIYNMDELASDTTKHRGKFIVGKDEGVQVRGFTVTPEGDHMPFHVSIALTTRADGKYQNKKKGFTDGAPPPFIVHARGHSKKDKKTKTKFDDPEHVTESQLEGLVPLGETTSFAQAYKENNEFGFKVVSQPNGSMTLDSMLPYAKHFVDNLPEDRPQDEPVILLLDGHGSRWNVEALNHLLENGVFPFYLPSHTSIWSQPNDNGVNKRLHSCIEIAARVTRSILAKEALAKGKKSYYQKDWNRSFRNAWENYMKMEQMDYVDTGSNVTTSAYQKTGIYPFNPDSSTWAEAIEGLGQFSTNKGGEFPPPSYGLVEFLPVPDLTREEHKLLVDNTLVGPRPDLGPFVEEDMYDALRSARFLCKRVLAKWREEYGKRRSALLNMIDETGGNTEADAEDEDCIIIPHGEDGSLVLTEEQELKAKELRELLPQSFVTSEQEKLAAKIICFEIVDASKLKRPVKPTKEEQRLEYTKRVLESTSKLSSIKVTHFGEDGVVQTGTAVRTDEDSWSLFLSSQPRDISTSELLNPDKYQVTRVESEKKDERQRRHQMEAARRKQTRERIDREERAKVEAHRRRNNMLKGHFLKIQQLGTSYSQSDFERLVKDIESPFECSVELDGHKMVAVATTRNTASALHEVVVRAVRDGIFKRKRDGEELDQRPAKKTRNTRQVATIQSEDSISGREHLNRRDARDDAKKVEAERKRTASSISVKENLLNQFRQYEAKNTGTYFQLSNFKTYVKMYYRIFGGEGVSQKDVNQMKEYLQENGIGMKQVVDSKVSKLKREIQELKERLAALPPAESDPSPEEQDDAEEQVGENEGDEDMDVETNANSG